MKPRIKAIAALVALFMVLAHSEAYAAATAEENYAFYCAQCHGTKGKGDGINATKEMPVSPRDHTSAVEMNKLTDDDIMNAIADGGPATSKSSLMPPFSKTLSKDEIKELKDYLRKLCYCKGK